MKWAGHVACMGRREVYTGFWRGGLREGVHLGDTDIDGNSASGIGGIYWIEVAQDRDRWHALVNVLMNLWVP